MPREAAGRVYAVADPADDRVRIRGHVVETGPGVDDRRAGDGRITLCKASTPVPDERVVDLLAARSARNGLRHREPERVATAAEVEARFFLHDHRQIGRHVGNRTDVDELATERTDR